MISADPFIEAITRFIPSFIWCRIVATAVGFGAKFGMVRKLSAIMAAQTHKASDIPCGT
jgi:hypothetical protein